MTRSAEDARARAQARERERDVESRESGVSLSNRVRVCKRRTTAAAAAAAAAQEDGRSSHKRGPRVSDGVSFSPTLSPSYSFQLCSLPPLLLSLMLPVPSRLLDQQKGVGERAQLKRKQELIISRHQQANAINRQVCYVESPHSFSCLSARLSLSVVYGGKSCVIHTSRPGMQLVTAPRALGDRIGCPASLAP